MAKNTQTFLVVEWNVWDLSQSTSPSRALLGANIVHLDKNSTRYLISCGFLFKCQLHPINIPGISRFLSQRLLVHMKRLNKLQKLERCAWGHRDPPLSAEDHTFYNFVSVSVQLSL